MKDNPPSQYDIGEKVFIRYPFSKTSKSRSGPKKRYVLKGKILKRKLNLHKYKVQYMSPITHKKEISWISVEDVTGLTREIERNKKEVAKNKALREKEKQIRKKNKSTIERQRHRRTFYIPLRKEDHIDEFFLQGYHVDFDPMGDGNCQFEALTHLLPTVGIFRSIKTLREEIVRYLQQNPNSVDGVPLEMFAGIPWEQYLSEMGRD
ncbi:hypothetical protein AC249_AIPGENE7713, partial [Exaiptasia diaphana]